MKTRPSSAPLSALLPRRVPRFLFLLLSALGIQLPAPLALSAAPFFESTLLFPAGENDRPNHRIPSLTRAKNGGLLAIVEKRNSGIGDVGDTDIIMRRSTDNGRTWGEIETIFDDGISTCTDITTVVTDAGPNAARIFLFFLKNKKKFACIHSDDHGATWVNAGANPNPGYEGLPMPFVIHDQVTVNDHAAKTGWDYLNGDASNNAADQPPATGSQAAEWERDWTQRYGIGPGNAAIQLKRQPAPALNGRILVSARHRERIGGGIQTWAHVFHSDDGGATWRLAPAATRILQNASESQLVELPDGTVYLNLRNETAADRDADATFRYVAVSTDGGATWHAPADAPGHKDTRLVSTVCHAAVELYENPANAADPNNGTVLFANPFSSHREEDHPYGRYRMSMRRGTAVAPGGAVTWSDPKIIYPHPASYADIAILADGGIGLLYERGDPGANSYWSELHFARFNLEWLDDPAARPATVPVRLANLFSEGMVLQRGKDVPVWGYASAGDTITVAFAGQTRTATADADGRWVAVLDPLDASATPRDMTVTGPGADNVVHIGNILVGDVWIASGQSNMNWDLNMLAREHPDTAPGIAADIAAATHLVRQFEALGATGSGADTFGRNEPDDNVTGVWTWSSPSTLTTGNFSATAWYFAREIHEKTGVPVGIINASVGGTVIEAWADPQTLDDPALAFAREDWPGKGKRDTASNLYNALVAPLAPVALKGFIWYQGEHNAVRAGGYAAVFTPFINGWRARFDAPSAPFYFVQLPNYAAGSADWPALRAAQASALALPATGMAVAIDIGDDGNIHPANKRAVGHRLARLARRHDYGETALEYSGPAPAAVITTAAAPAAPADAAPAAIAADDDGGANGGADSGQLVITFDHADGLHLDTTKNRPGLAAFEIAAATGAFYPATPALEGRTLRLFAPEVPAPRRARYAWHNTPSTPLYNAAGLPAAPFSVEAGFSPSDLAPPGDHAAAPGQQITLRAAIAGDMAAAALIRWQVSADAGATWRDIGADPADAGVYSGETTAALVIKAATAGMDGLRFRYLAGTTADNGVPSPASTLAVSPALSVSPVSRTASATAGTVTFAVTNAGAGTLVYTATLAAGCDWTAITSGAAGSLGAGESANVTISHAMNPAGAGARAATLTFTAGDAATGSPQTVTLTQTANPDAPALVVDKIILALARSAGDADTFTVTGNVPWSATIAPIGGASAGWLGVSPAGGAAGVSVTGTAIALGENISGALRAAAIAIAGGGLERAIIVTQRAAASGIAAPAELATGATLAFDLGATGAEAHIVVAGGKLAPAAGGGGVSCEYVPAGDIATLILDDAVWTLNFATRAYRLFAISQDTGRPYELAGGFTYTVPVAFAADGVTVTPANKTVSPGHPYGELPAPERAGHTFDGWFAADGAKITAASTVPINTGPHTLHARWTATGGGGGGGGGGAPGAWFFFACAVIAALRLRQKSKHDE